MAVSSYSEDDHLESSLSTASLSAKRRGSTLHSSIASTLSDQQFAMGQDVSRLSQECDCWVSDEATQSVPVHTAMVDPVANLIAKDVPEHTLLKPKPAPVGRQVLEVI